MVFFCNYFLVQIAQVFHERDARRDLDARDLVLGDAVEVLEQAADRVAVRRHEHLPRERQPRRGGRGPKPRADARRRAQTRTQAWVRCRSGAGSWGGAATTGGREPYRLPLLGAGAICSSHSGKQRSTVSLRHSHSGSTAASMPAYSGSICGASGV